jgi:hypothetical protein
MKLEIGREQKKEDQEFEVEKSSKLKPPEYIYNE